MKHQKTIEQDVINFIEKSHLIVGAKKILITLSGGADSVFALHFFYKYSKKYKIQISVMHVNHQLRENESKRDEEFCRKLSQKLDLEFNCSYVNVKAYAVKHRKSIEEAARELRYAEFDKIAHSVNADLIVTAHNRDDNTETVLLNLVNGTGLSGISGIPVKRDKIIRPILCLSKESIEEYLISNKIKFVEDSSNQNIEFKRNFLRKEVIPLLKKNINPVLDKAILQSSEIFRNQEKLNDYFVDQIFQSVVKKSKDQIVISTSRLNQYPDEILGELFKKIINIYSDQTYTYSQSIKFKSLLNSQIGKKIEIGRKTIAVRERDCIIIKKEDVHNPIFKEFSIGDKIKIRDVEIKSEYIECLPDKYVKNGEIEFISGDKLEGKLKVRDWESGDRIKLLGMKETKKISDVLTDLKIPFQERKHQLVILNKADIIWLVGKRISENYKITGSTKKIVKLCLS